MSRSARTSLRGLRTFCLVARYLSFRAAADALFVTPSAVSHQIKALEARLGTTLIRRGSGEVALTDDGQALFDSLAPLIDRIDDIVGRFEKRGDGGTVRVSVQPFFGSEFFVPRLREFTAEQPDIDIQVGTSDEASEKHPADADLSVRLFSKPPSGFGCKRLFPLRLVSAGSPEFRDGIRVERGRVVSKFPLIVHETLARAWSLWPEASGIALPEGSKVTRFDSMIAVVRAAQRGLGAALVPMPLARAWFDEGSLVRLFDDELVMESGYYLVWKSGADERRAVKLLRDWILATFSDDGEKNSTPP